MLMQELEESGTLVLQLVESIEPFDQLEALHKAEVIAWIISGSPLFRIAKPAEPPKHLVTYFVVVDAEAKSILLVDHLKAKKWLPTGGHVEPEEHPRATVEREVLEELGISAKFTKCFGDKPLFLTSTITVGQTAGHTDVTLWYVLDATQKDVLRHDQDEFTKTRWFSFEEILNLDAGVLDLHMHRFVRKLLSRFEAISS